MLRCVVRCGQRNWNGRAFSKSYIHSFIHSFISIQPWRPGLAGTRAQSCDRYGSGTLHPGQVLWGSLPLLSPAFRRTHFSRQVPPSATTGEILAAKGGTNNFYNLLQITNQHDVTPNHSHCTLQTVAYTDLQNLLGHPEDVGVKFFRKRGK